MTYPLLSVLVVTYKSMEEIDDCLRTIPQELLGRSVEVIVVDNDSSDGIAAYVRDQFPDVTLIESPENLGFGRASNLAYEESSGEYVLFLNPDTVSNEEAYLGCLERLAEDENIGIISPKLVMANGEMDLACRRSIPTIWDGFCRATGLASAFPRVRLFSGYNLTHLADDESYDVGSVNGAFMMAPRGALLRFGVFDEQLFMYAEDLDLCYRCRQAGFRVVYNGRLSLVHLKGMSSNKDSEKMAGAIFSATKQFYLKHFNPQKSVLVSFKYAALFLVWQKLASFKAWVSGHKKARPL